MKTFSLSTLKNYFLFSFIIFNILNPLLLLAQNTRTVAGRDYEKFEEVWYVHWNSDTFKVDMEVVTIKYEAEVSSQDIRNFEEQNQLQLIRQNRMGFIDYAINELTNVLDFVENVALPSALIQSVDINTFGRYSGAIFPNDWGPNLWHIHQANDADINAPEAWDLTSGCPEIIVAVIDAGADTKHEDLGYGIDNYHNMYLNPAENDWSDPGDPSSGNGVDDDGNGFVDDWWGWNFEGNNNDVNPPGTPQGFFMDHGTQVTGIIGEKTNNSLGWLGIASGWTNQDNKGTSNLLIKIGGFAPLAAVLDDAIIYATQMGSNIIQLALLTVPSAAIDAAIQDAYENYGIFIVCSSGDNPGVPVYYPANNPYVFAVGGTDAQDNKWVGATYGEDLDISAPADFIFGLGNWNTYIYSFGTSFSAPMVSAVASMMLCVNPCLSNLQIADVLRHSANKVGGYNYYWDNTRPGHSVELGYGRLDAYKAVLTAQEMYIAPPTVDLYIRDNCEDLGIEPNPDNGPMWISDDIWVRRQQDGLINQEHENPLYDPTLPDPQYNYVYVRVRNKSCEASDGIDDFLKLYWAKAASALDWDNFWNGSQTCNGGPSMGNIVSTQNIPVIQPGGEAILEFQWEVQDPDLYNNCNTEPWHFCFLARIETPDDPMHSQEIANLYHNVKENNNIAWKNVTVVFPPNSPPPVGDCLNDKTVGGVIAVGNPFSDHEDNYDLIFKLPDNYRGNILDEAEVRVILDAVTWQKWANGGYQGDNIEVRREDCRQIIITNSPASIRNLNYAIKERSTINLSFNFLIDKISSEHEFDYHVIQVRNEDQKIIGGELYQIRKSPRSSFNADAGGDKLQSKNDSTTLSASSIGEPAIYNWYDESGNLVYTGKDFTVSADMTKKYKLEVIALSDGFVDYDSLTVQVKEFEIKSLNPNPATNQITVEYDTENATSAFITITQAFQNGGNNYILDVSESSTIINLSGYSPGVYSVILFCNGDAADIKQLVIQ